MTDTEAPPPQRNQDMLQQLPRELQQRIMSHLSLQDTNRFSKVNRHFHALVHPQLRPVAEKKDFA